MKSLYVFDLDETLFSHDAEKLKIYLLDADGRRVKSISSSEYSSEELPNGFSYDYSEFRSSDIFKESAKPIDEMIAIMNRISARHETIILTARSDFDDQLKFDNIMSSHGIDINEIHVYRAGNRPGKACDTKAEIVRELVDREGYEMVCFFDDSLRNINKMAELAETLVDVIFELYHVSYKDNHVQLIKNIKKHYEETK